MDEKTRQANQRSQAAWDQNAAYWDKYMGEGNAFVEVLTWPAVERLMALKPGMRVLDAACGNGLTSRRMAALGAEVVAFDFSEPMIAHARARSGPGKPVIYHVLDATDEDALLGLGEGSFDAALSAMALMDMAEIEPLFRALARLLKPGGHFVFASLHPCFNTQHTIQTIEGIDNGREFVNLASIKITQYMTPSIKEGIALRGQPEPQLYFHRPLQQLLGAAFQAGFVVDGFEERAFPADPAGTPTSTVWSPAFSEFPPVLVVRARRPEY